MIRNGMKVQVRASLHANETSLSRRGADPSHASLYQRESIGSTPDMAAVMAWGRNQRPMLHRAVTSANAKWWNTMQRRSTGKQVDSDLKEYLRLFGQLQSEYRTRS